jgi:hypothetical protein
MGERLNPREAVAVDLRAKLVVLPPAGLPRQEVGKARRVWERLDERRAAASASPGGVSSRGTCARSPISCQLLMRDPPRANGSRSDPKLTKTLACDCQEAGFAGGRFKVANRLVIAPPNPR